MPAKIPQHAIVLTADEAAMLYQNAQLEELRKLARGRDEALHRLLVMIWETALLSRPISGEGKPARVTTEKLETGSIEVISPKRIAQRLGVTARTVRNDIRAGILPATKNGRYWLITPEAAKIYLASRQK